MGQTKLIFQIECRLVIKCFIDLSAIGETIKAILKLIFGKSKKQSIDISRNNQFASLSDSY